jgi:hypothetical protein
MQADPRLKLDASGLYRLQAGSPAINRASGSFPFVKLDMDGQPRDRKPDIGADEFSSKPVVNRLLTPADVGPEAH